VVQILRVDVAEVVRGLDLRRWLDRPAEEANTRRGPRWLDRLAKGKANTG
jgi:hypothetical protein